MKPAHIVWITATLSDSLDGSTSVVEAGLVQQQTLMELPGTLLGFEATGPAGPSLYGVGVAGRESLLTVGLGVLRLLLSPCFGGGVWCLICG